MAEYIDRDSVCYQLLKHATIDGQPRAIRRAAKIVANFPAAAVLERKTGVWIGEGDGYADDNMVYDMWSCSVCGEYFVEWDDKPTWNYCPNCGAKMVGGDDDV